MFFIIIFLLGWIGLIASTVFFNFYPGYEASYDVLAAWSFGTLAFIGGLGAIVREAVISGCHAFERASMRKLQMAIDKATEAFGFRAAKEAADKKIEELEGMLVKSQEIIRENIRKTPKFQKVNIAGKTLEIPEYTDEITFEFPYSPFTGERLIPEAGEPTDTAAPAPRKVPVRDATPKPRKTKSKK